MKQNSSISQSPKAFLLLGFLFVVLVAIVLYSPSLQGEFSSLDDDFYIPLIGGLQGHYGEIFKPGFDPSNYYHPLLFLSLAVDFIFWKSNPVGYHITNLLLLVVLLYLCLLVSLALSGEPEIALLSLLVFAIHPVHAEGVAWILGRCHLLGTLFCMASFYLFIKWEKDKKILYYFGSILLFISALLTQVLTAVLPILILLYLFSSRSLKKFGEQFKAVVPFFLLVIGFGLLLYISDAFRERMVETQNLPFYYKLLTSVSLMGQTLKLIFWPANLCAVYPMKVETSLLNPNVIWSLIGILLYTGGLVYAFIKDKKIFFALGWFLLSSLPLYLRIFFNSNFFLADRYLFLPSYGLCLAFGLFYSIIKRRVKILLFIQGLLLLIFSFLSILTLERATLWSSNFLLWSDTLQKAPESYYPHFGLAIVYGKKGLHEKAIEEFKKSLRLMPPNIKESHIRLAYELYLAGHFEEGIIHAREALKLNPNNYFVQMILKEMIKEKNKQLKPR